MTEYVASAGGLLVPDTKLLLGGVFTVEHWRDGELLGVSEEPNLVVNEGLNSVLGVYLHADTQITSWFVGLFEANYTPVATVTAATITAASTESTAYTSATRPAYSPAAAASQSIDNSASKATFTFNATKTIYGAFVVSSSTKSGTSGTLLAAAQFGSSKAVVNTDQLLVTYTFGASSV